MPDLTNRAQGIKKSNFVAATSFLGSATFDFVINGTNKKILASDLLTALGVTGTIVQDGDPLGTPVLDTQGTVNNIRNLEDGPGVKASVSPQNGITLEHSFVIDATGEPIMQNETDDTPDFVSLVGLAAVSLATNGKTIEISGTGKQVIVSISALYQVLIVDDIISSTGSHNVTLPNIAGAIKEVTIQSVSGVATLLGDATIQAPTTVAGGASATLFPAGGQWWHK